MKFHIRGYHPLWQVFPDLSIISPPPTLRSRNPPLQAKRFRLFPFRSPLLRESQLISTPEGTEMYHFPSFASQAYVFSLRYLRFTQAGFPIRKSPDQGLFSGSPRLIAAFYVLLRLLTPRHPPYALSSLTTIILSARILILSVLFPYSIVKEQSKLRLELKIGNWKLKI